MLLKLTPRVRDCRARAVFARLVAVFLLQAGSAWGAGTPANTAITNIASVTYRDGGTGSTLTVNSNVTLFRVDERLDVAIVSNLSGNVGVTTPDNDKPLSFTVTNTGNGSEAFRLVADPALGGDNFDPTDTRIYLDSNGNGVFDAATDTLYVAGTNDPVLAPDQAAVVFVTNDTPAGRSSGDVGLVRLTATAVTGSGVPGTTFAGKGTGGTDAVVGASTANASAQSGYVVAQVATNLNKTQAVADPYGGTNPVSGAIVTYTLTLTVSGAGTVTNTRITDSIPVNTAYVAGSLRLNGAALSDVADADAGRFTGTDIEVILGALTAPSTQTVVFQVRIN